MENDYTALYSSLNYFSQAAAHFANAANNKATNERNQKNQETQWDREDNAYWRKAQDMARAGLNPQLAASGAGSSSSLSQSQIPYKNEAPEFDSGSVLQSMGLKMQERKQVADISHTQAQTDWIRQQAAEQKIMNLDTLMNSAQNRSRSGVDMERLNTEMERIRHDLQYAREHNLPVGTSDTLIRQFEYVFDAIRSLTTGQGNSILASYTRDIGQALTTKAKSIG